jgi:hypothetical protein
MAVCENILMEVCTVCEDTLQTFSRVSLCAEDILGSSGEEEYLMKAVKFPMKVCELCDYLHAAPQFF